MAVAARIEVLKGEVERTLRASQERVGKQCEDFEHKAMVFEEWLEARRQAASIEWFWGTADQTSRTEKAI